MCMVQKWRGHTPTEELHHEGALAAGHGLERASRLEGAIWKPLGESDDHELALHLDDGGIAIVGVAGFRFIPWQLKKYPNLVSKHGEWWTPGKYGRNPPFHAIVLVKWDVQVGILFFDPWFPGAGQPLAISLYDFSKCFDGYAFLFTR